MSVLTAPDIHARNTFDQPNVVVPRAGEVKISGTSVAVTFPPASVAAVQLQIA